MIKVTNSGNEIDLDNLILFATDEILVSDSANVFNGYSYSDPVYGIQVYTPNEFLDGIRTPMRHFIYLPNYDTNIGYEGLRASKERVICDFLLYPEKLGAYQFLPDALEGYMEENGSFENVCVMMDTMGIPRSELDKWTPLMWSDDM